MRDSRSPGQKRYDFLRNKAEERRETTYRQQEIEEEYARAKARDVADKIERMALVGVVHTREQAIAEGVLVPSQNKGFATDLQDLFLQRDPSYKEGMGYQAHTQSVNDTTRKEDDADRRMKVFQPLSVIRGQKYTPAPKVDEKDLPVPPPIKKLVDKGIRRTQAAKDKEKATRRYEENMLPGAGMTNVRFPRPQAGLEVWGQVPQKEYNECHQFVVDNYTNK